jgi:hypothetical protein
MIGSFIGRVAGVFFAFVFAVLTAIVTLFWVGGQWTTRRFQSEITPDDPFYGFSEVFGAVSWALETAPLLTIAPAVLAIIIGEVLKIRSLLYYVAAGGAAAAIMPFLPANELTQPLSAQYIAILATAGFAAGLVYWVIAGRNA